MVGWFVFVFFNCVHINPEKVNSQYIFRACLEGSFCGFFLFLNTFLFPGETSAVTSRSTADIKTDFQSPKKKKNKASNFAIRNPARDLYGLFFSYTLNTEILEVLLKR